jgi:nucleotide-binding universal stress UspA family protein
MHIACVFFTVGAKRSRASRRLITVYRRILVPVHGGALDEHAIDLAASVCDRKGGSHLTLVYVVEVPQRMSLDSELPCEIEDGETVLKAARDYAESKGDAKWRKISAELLQARMASSAIVDESIERGADAIVLATANRRRRGSLTQGDTVPFVMDNAPCNVLVIRSSTLEGSY